MLRIIWLFSFVTAFAQTPIQVAENNFRIKSGSEVVFYYAFSEGDQMIFSFTEEHNNPLKNIQISEYKASSPFFKEYKTSDVSQKVFKIQKTGVLEFKFVNEALFGRTGLIKIERIPASEKTQKFNTAVEWKTVSDTIYDVAYDKYTVKRDTAAISLVDQTTKVSSRNAINGNTNTAVVDFKLPENTISWGYYIGVGKEGAEAYAEAKNSFLKTAVKAISTFSGYGAMAELGLHGINMFQKAQGGDNVKYWFLQDEKSVKAFRETQKFYQYKQGDVVNDASQMKKPLTGKVYLGLLNDNIIEPIEIFVKVTAITVTETKVYNKPLNFRLISKQEPFIKL